MVRVPGPRQALTPLATAQEMDSWGFQVIPARHGDKAPLVDWKRHQTVRTTKLLAQWFKEGRQVNYWIMCGQISKIVVVDCDSAAGDRWWREQLGNELMDATTRVKTSKGHHYYFKIPAEYTTTVKSWSVHEGELSFDVRADRTGVIAPPSVHESGLVYTWEVPFSSVQVAPAALLDGSLRAVTGDTAENTGAATRPSGGTGPRSLLARLLDNPPAEGGRNDWLTKVAGHYAKLFHGARDAYDQHVRDSNAKLTPPLDEDELVKTLESIWESEHENNQQRSLDADCGWIKGNGKSLFTQVQVREGEERAYDIEIWANFDITARGVTRDLDQSKVFWVVLHTRDGDLELLLRATTLGDDRKFKAWLAGYGCTVWAPVNMWPREGTPGVRVQRYLESQDPPTIEVTEALGWNGSIRGGEGGFVTHGGVILASGPVSADESGVRADPILLSGGFAPHQYGFERDDTEATRVLAEVLSFHEEHVTSVFGAWWAACLLKPQLQANSALFPFVGIQAPSESGKTNGFFDMMVQLNGNTRGEVVPTKAVLRNMLAAHNNGLVWVDDLDDPDYLMELLRAATSGGTITKMGEDRASSASSTLVAPIVISGEQLGIGNQKALLDRAIMIQVGSPTGRRSKHDSSRPQWDDVLELRRQYPRGLSVLAGWYVQRALQVEERVLAALRASRTGTGRAGDKVAILRAGARLLDYLCGHDGAWDGQGSHALQVEDWAAARTGENAIAADNALTLEAIPWALRSRQFPSRPQLGEHGQPATPVWIQGWENRDEIGAELTVWVNTDLLAEAWRLLHRSVEVRTHTESALRDQLEALGGVGLKQFRLQGAQGHNGPRTYYRSVTGETARVLIRRAQSMH